MPFINFTISSSSAIKFNNKFSHIILEKVFLICKKKLPPSLFLTSSHNGLIPFLKKYNSDPEIKSFGYLKW